MVMKNTKDVVYLKHPVSAEEKAKHIADGKRIIDIKFKPAEAKKPVKKTAKKAEKPEA
jgi:hypothetical protein